MSVEPETPESYPSRWIGRMELRIPHVQIEPRGEWIAVVVDDYELFDWIDDHLAERDLVCVRMEPPSTLLLGPQVDRQAIIDVLNLLDPEEVDRVYKLNHQTSGDR